MTVTPRLLTARQVADYLSVSEATVRRMAGRGELPKPLSIGGVKRWDRNAIDRDLDALGNGGTRYGDPDEAIARIRDAQARRRQTRAA